jgi:HAMP domain-containing protein
MGAGIYRPKPPPLSWRAKWIWVAAVVAIVALVAIVAWLIVTKSPPAPIPP